MEDIPSYPILLIIVLSAEPLQQMQSPGFYLICSRSSTKQVYPYLIIDSSSDAKNARRLAKEYLVDWFALSHYFAAELYLSCCSEPFETCSGLFVIHFIIMSSGGSSHSK